MYSITPLWFIIHAQRQYIHIFPLECCQNQFITFRCHGHVHLKNTILENLSLLLVKFICLTQNTTYSRSLRMLTNFILSRRNCGPWSIGWEALKLKRLMQPFSPQLFSRKVEWYIFWKVARKGRDLSSQTPFLHLKDARKGLSKTLWAFSSFTRQNKVW